jgi:hypothetical protein
MSAITVTQLCHRIIVDEVYCLHSRYGIVLQVWDQLLLLLLWQAVVICWLPPSKNFAEPSVAPWRRIRSVLGMIRDQMIRRRQRLFDDLPVTGEVLRGSLLERTLRNHPHGCAKCASGEGHPLSVLTVTYPGQRTQQISLSKT